MRARDIALASILTALQIITLLISYVIPTIKLALLFAAALYPGVLLRIGVKRRTVTASFFASAALTVLLVQVPEIQAGFIALFGWYALLHEGTKHMHAIRRQLIRWAGFISAAGLAFIAFTYIVPIEITYALWAAALAGAAAFIVMQILYEFTVREFIKLSKIRLIDGKIKFK